MMFNGFTVPHIRARVRYRYELLLLAEAIEGKKDPEAIDLVLAFRERWHMKCEEQELPLYLAGFHRWRMYAEEVRPELRGWSAHWLHERGFPLERDREMFATRTEEPKP